MRIILRHLLSQLLVYASLLSTSERAAAYTSNDARTLYADYVRAFYVQDGDAGWFKKTQKKGAADFWEEAEEIETIIDCHEAAPQAGDKALIGQLLEGFLKNNGTNWSTNIYNDDCMWASIAFARGSQVTGKARFKEIARWNFDMVMARGWDDVLGGGIYWTTDNRCKNSCVNGPAGIAACLLAQLCNEPWYLVKAGEIFDWERAHLFNPDTGAVADSLEINGKIHGWASTYNQGTFIGLANFLGHTNDAGLAANFTRTTLSRDGLLPRYGVAGNNSGFNAIFLRWMSRYMRDRRLENVYLPWLQANASAAWKVRRPTDGLSWCEWQRPTSGDKILDSWDCIASLEALYVATPPEATASARSFTSTHPPK